MAFSTVRLSGRLIPLLFLLLSASTAAHVTWIEPSAFLARPGEEVELTLRVGEEFVGDTLVYLPEWFIRFSLFHDGEETAVDGDMGDDPAGKILIRKPGSYLVLYENKPDFVELEPEKFRDYLRENGLEHVISKREALGESEEPAGEYYSRCAKTVVTTDGDILAGGSMPSGCTLDLLLESLPQERDGETRFRLLFKGKPAAGVLVTGIARANPQARLGARTDGEGSVHFPALHPGTWLFSAVQMIREEREQAKWRSYWASMTFRLP
jgi:uncharacterized GH25 family protein